MSSDSKAIFDYIFNLTVPGVKLELSRVEQFMELLGDPHQAYPVIHIAGTNGKGSTAAMLATILNAHGVKTGLFTSPHLLIPNERIRIGDVLIPDDFIIEKVETWRPHIDSLGITFFEVLTALGMVYFKEQGVELAVFETGLGGRLDATNVVDPVLSIITAVSMDHENILGDTIEKIAMEKAGIIKTGKPLILGKNTSAVCAVVEDVCDTKGSSITYVPDVAEILESETKQVLQHIRISLADQIFEVRLPLLGLHQTENFSNVLVALDQLDFDLDQQKIQSGLDELQWWGRLQPLQLDPLVLYDVAHNPEGLERLLESLNESGLKDSVLIVAFNARKNITGLLNLLSTWSAPVLFTIFEGYSALSQEALIQQGVDPTAISQNPQAAYAKALELRDHKKQSICFLGSHYLAESLFELFDFDFYHNGNKK